jgi:putative DNA primase/helicase
VITGQLTNFLQGAFALDGRQNRVPFMPRKTSVEEALYFVENGLTLSEELVAPGWIESGEPATDWVVCTNCMVNVRTGETRGLGPELFATSGVDWAWQPEAECPRWREFLGEVFPGDGESQEFIEEWLAYCMTSDTRFQKAAMYVGETRGGKGTIVQVMEGLLGEGNYVGLS